MVRIHIDGLNTPRVDSLPGLGGFLRVSWASHVYDHGVQAPQELGLFVAKRPEIAPLSADSTESAWQR